MYLSVFLFSSSIMFFSATTIVVLVSGAILPHQDESGGSGSLLTLMTGVDDDYYDNAPEKGDHTNGGDDCLDALERCETSEVCSWHLLEVRQECSGTQQDCDREECAKAVARFATYVPRESADALMFCRCPSAEDSSKIRRNKCLEASRVVYPRCLYATGSTTTGGTPKRPQWSCLQALKLCQMDFTCRRRLLALKEACPLQLTALSEEKESSDGGGKESEGIFEESSKNNDGEEVEARGERCLAKDLGACRAAIVGARGSLLDTPCHCDGVYALGSEKETECLDAAAQMIPNHRCLGPVIEHFNNQKSSKSDTSSDSKSEPTTRTSTPKRTSTKKPLTTAIGGRKSGMRKEEGPSLGDPVTLLPSIEDDSDSGENGERDRNKAAKVFPKKAQKSKGKDEASDKKKTKNGDKKEQKRKGEKNGKNRNNEEEYPHNIGKVSSTESAPTLSPTAETTTKISFDSADTIDKNNSEKFKEKISTTPKVTSNDTIFNDAVDENLDFERDEKVRREEEEVDDEEEEEYEEEELFQAENDAVKEGFLRNKGNETIIIGGTNSSGPIAQSLKTPLSAINFGRNRTTPVLSSTETSSQTTSTFSYEEGGCSTMGIDGESLFHRRDTVFRQFSDWSGRCSDWCECSADAELSCHELGCLPDTRCEAPHTTVEFGERLYLGERGACVCQAGRFICDSSPAMPKQLEPGLYISLGYSRSELGLIREKVPRAALERSGLVSTASALESDIASRLQLALERRLPKEVTCRVTVAGHYRQDSVILLRLQWYGVEPALGAGSSSSPKQSNSSSSTINIPRNQQQPAEKPRWHSGRMEKQCAPAVRELEQQFLLEQADRHQLVLSVVKQFRTIDLLDELPPVNGGTRVGGPLQSHPPILIFFTTILFLLLKDAFFHYSFCRRKGKK